MGHFFGVLVSMLDIPTMPLSATHHDDAILYLGFLFGGGAIGAIGDTDTGCLRKRFCSSQDGGSFDKREISISHYLLGMGRRTQFQLQIAFWLAWKN